MTFQDESFRLAFLARKKPLFFYSPVNFLREISAENQIEKIIRPKTETFFGGKNKHIFRTEIAGKTFFFLYEFLPWDSDFFGFKTYKLFSVFYENREGAEEACRQFARHLFEGKAEKIYCFSEIPPEDIELIQALNAAGFRLIESRQTYFRDNLTDFSEEIYRTRPAVEADIPGLEKVAARMRNDYDRVHADPTFSPETADRFLAEYVKQSVLGYADSVLVPAEEGVPAEAFFVLTFSSEGEESAGRKIGKIVLTAAAPSCRGWHAKLLRESCRFLALQGCDSVVMTTQITNRAVIRNSEKAGFSSAFFRQILAIRN